MKFSRLTNPEISNSVDMTNTESYIRRIGGSTLGILGYGFGVGSITGIGPSAGLSLPILGGISAALFAGSRAVLRPAYQTDAEYGPVLDESFGEKAKRVGLFVGGIAVASTGINLFTGGIFNGFDRSVGILARGASVAAGYIAIKYGFRAVRGTFDPELFSDTASAPTQTKKSLWQTAKDSFSDGLSSGRSTNRRISSSKNSDIFAEIAKNAGEEYKALLLRRRTDPSIDFDVESDRIKAKFSEQIATASNRSVDPVVI